jgi:hypothetical protein
VRKIITIAAGVAALIAFSAASEAAELIFSTKAKIGSDIQFQQDFGAKASPADIFAALAGN